LPSDKYGIIKRIYFKYKKDRRLMKNNLTISIKRLCQIASVSISGYYKWKSNEKNRIARLEKEIADYEIIYKIFTNHQETVGFRTITMELKQHYSIIMNHKKVIRLMKKYKLKCKIRRKRTYGNTFDKNRIEHTYPNLTNTKFDCVKPYSVLHTDITYIKFAYAGKTAYLSAIKDQTTREILAYKISNSLTFFGHMKDEVNFNILQTLEEVVEIIDKYIYYYNNNRPQWTLKKMTPIEYRNHLLSVA
jgi:transposase InsO family protein